MPTQVSAVRAIVFGGLAVAVLDAADALIAFGLLGSSPIQIYQYVASGLLGAAAFKGGVSTALLGVALHCFIAFALTTFFYVLARNLPIITGHWIFSGLVYGVAAYMFMSYVIIPLSAAPKSAFSWALLLNGIFGHGLLVGLPIAWFAARFGRPAFRASHVSLHA